jgi:hypothetical protein
MRIKIPKKGIRILYFINACIEYYFYVNWNILIEVWNIKY